MRGSWLAGRKADRAQDIAARYYRYLYRFLEMPTVWISDNAGPFVSQFTRTINEITGTKHRRGSSLHRMHGDRGFSPDPPSDAQSFMDIHAAGTSASASVAAVPEDEPLQLQIEHASRIHSAHGGAYADEGVGAAMPLWIVNGNQMAIDRIRSIQTEAVESAKAFDKRGFIVASPAWFHTDTNCAFTLLHTHWKNNEGEHLDHCLFDDISFWSLKGISNQKPKFFLIQSLLLRNFRSRVVAIFLQEMIDLKLLNVGTGAGVGVAANQGDMSHLETVKAAVRGLSPVAYLWIVPEVDFLMFGFGAIRTGSRNP